MIKYSNPLGGGGSSTATLPDQIINLACVGGTDGTAGTIDISFTEVPSTSWDLLKNYVVVYKEGSIPQTPFDGYRIVLEKGTASTNKIYQITGLTFDQLYGVRIYPISIKNQYQTLAEGATATATPVNGLLVSTLPIETPIRISDGTSIMENGYIIDIDHYGKQESLIICRSVAGTYKYAPTTDNTLLYSQSDLRNTLINSVPAMLYSNIVSNLIAVPIKSNSSTLNDSIFAFSFAELSLPSRDVYYAITTEGIKINYFTTHQEHFKSILGFTRNDEVGFNDWTRTRNYQGEGYANNIVGLQYYPSYTGTEWVRTLSTTSSAHLLFGLCLSPNARVSLTPNADGSYNLI